MPSEPDRTRSPWGRYASAPGGPHGASGAPAAVLSFFGRPLVLSPNVVSGVAKADGVVSYGVCLPASAISRRAVDALASLIDAGLFYASALYKLAARDGSIRYYLLVVPQSASESVALSASGLGAFPRAAETSGGIVGGEDAFSQGRSLPAVLPRSGYISLSAFLASRALGQFDPPASPAASSGVAPPGAGLSPPAAATQALPGPPNDPVLVGAILPQILALVDACHRSGLVHGAIVPSNIFLNEETGALRLGPPIQFYLRLLPVLEATSAASREGVGVSSRGVAGARSAAASPVSPAGEMALAMPPELFLGGGGKAADGRDKRSPGRARALPFYPESWMCGMVALQCLLGPPYVASRVPGLEVDYKVELVSFLLETLGPPRDPDDLPVPRKAAERLVSGFSGVSPAIDDQARFPLLSPTIRRCVRLLLEFSPEKRGSPGLALQALGGTGIRLSAASAVLAAPVDGGVEGNGSQPRPRDSGDRRETRHDGAPPPHCDSGARASSAGPRSLEPVDEIVTRLLNSSRAQLRELVQAGNEAQLGLELLGARIADVAPPGRSRSAVLGGVWRDRQCPLRAPAVRTVTPPTSFLHSGDSGSAAGLSAPRESACPAKTGRARTASRGRARMLASHTTCGSLSSIEAELQCDPALQEWYAEYARRDASEQLAEERAALRHRRDGRKARRRAECVRAALSALEAEEAEDAEGSGWEHGKREESPKSGSRGFQGSPVSRASHISRAPRNSRDSRDFRGHRDLDGQPRSLPPRRLSPGSRSRSSRSCSPQSPPSPQVPPRPIPRSPRSPRSSRFLGGAADLRSGHPRDSADLSGEAQQQPRQSPRTQPRPVCTLLVHRVVTHMRSAALADFACELRPTPSSDYRLLAAARGLEVPEALEPGLSVDVGAVLPLYPAQGPSGRQSAPRPLPAGVLRGRLVMALREHGDAAGNVRAPSAGVSAELAEGLTGELTRGPRRGSTRSQCQDDSSGDSAFLVGFPLEVDLRRPPKGPEWVGSTDSRLCACVDIRY